MQTLDAIATRRQRRHFTDEPIDADTLEAILRAASSAPSARNRQRWNYVVVTNRAKLDELTNVWPGAAWVNRSAATVALIVPQGVDQDERSAIRFDLGQSAMLLMLAATDFGLASGQANCADQELARSILGFPDDHECAMLIALGHPARGTLETATGHARFDLDSIVHHDRWSPAS